MSSIKSFFSGHFLWVMLILAALITFDWLVVNKKRLPMKWYVALCLSALHVIVGVLCVKFFALLEAGFDAQKAGNMSLFGAVFFLPLFYFAGAKLTRSKTEDVFDVFAIAMIVTLLFARFNCLKTGCCIGRIIGQTEARWPTREAEIAFYLVFLVIMAPRVFLGKSRGTVYPVYMVAYGAFRAVIECFRVSAATEGIFHLSHIWAILSLIIGIVVLLIMKKRMPINDHK